MSDEMYNAIFMGVTLANTLGNAFFAQCFAEGTPVATEDGQKPIEDIEVGDKVWAYDEQTGEKALKEVVQLFRNSTSSWICTDIEVDGKTETIKSTAEHPYYVLKLKPIGKLLTLRVEIAKAIADNGLRLKI